MFIEMSTEPDFSAGTVNLTKKRMEYLLSGLAFLRPACSDRRVDLTAAGRYNW
jgi:hypothetical protein